MRLISIIFYNLRKDAQLDVLFGKPNNDDTDDGSAGNAVRFNLFPTGLTHKLFISPAEGLDYS